MLDSSIFWLRAAALIYGVGLVHSLLVILNRSKGFYSFALGFFRVGAVVHGVAIVELARSEGRLPVESFYSTLSLCALLVTVVSSVFYLVQERRLKSKNNPGKLEKLPPLGTLDNLISSSLGFGFVFITLGVIFGVLWAFIELGTSWLGNASITLSFITWGLCLLMIFMLASAGWRGRKAAVMALVVLGCGALTWIAHAGLRPALIP